MYNILKTAWVDNFLLFYLKQCIYYNIETWLKLLLFLKDYTNYYYSLQLRGGKSLSSQFDLIYRVVTNCNNLFTDSKKSK